MKLNNFLSIIYNDLETHWLISVLSPELNDNRKNKLNFLLQSYQKGTTENITNLANTIEKNYNFVYNDEYLKTEESKIIQFSLYQK
jgi:hypothetical protein